MANNEVKNNEESKKSKKKLFIILGSAVGACAVAGASVGIYFAVKGNNGGKVVTTVTEQEFDKAISNEGVEYLQTHVLGIKDPNGIHGEPEVEMDWSFEIAPKVCYSHLMDERENKFFYAWQISDTKDKYIMKEGEGDWGKTEKEEEIEDSKIYMTPQKTCTKTWLSEIVGDFKFKDFNYDKNKKCYFARYESKDSSFSNEEKSTDYIYISFKNKRVTTVTDNAVNEEDGELHHSIEITYEYKNKTPQDPRK